MEPTEKGSTRAETLEEQGRRLKAALGSGDMERATRELHRLAQIYVASHPPRKRLDRSSGSA